MLTVGTGEIALPRSFVSDQNGGFVTRGALDASLRGEFGKTWKNCHTTP
jgi:hypothetical protein